VSYLIEITYPVDFGRKLVLVLASTCGVLAIFTLLSDPLQQELRRFNIEAGPFGIALLITTISLFTLNYLQSGKGKDDRKPSASDRINNEFDEIAKKIADLEQHVAYAPAPVYPVPEVIVSDEERQRALSKAFSALGEETVSRIFQNNALAIKEELQKSVGADRVKLSASEVINRLRREITDLRLRSNANLVIGLSITGIGVWLLWSTVSIIESSPILKILASEGDISNIKFLKTIALSLLPKISIVIFVEIFAYFFLRLHRDGLAEIKYFQNELTNVESKLIALESAFASNQPNAIKHALKALSDTERNHILEKGQTTVELERAKADSEYVRQFAKTIPSFFKKTKGD
jgi:hypothetical protein